jgi:23S rRNA (cytosine1962-C5)-methyltransferase
MDSDRPRLKLQPGGDKRAMLGHPWIFSNELIMDAAVKMLPPGTIVTLVRPDGRPLGAAYFNPHSLIAARLLTRDADKTIDEAFLHSRLKRALKLRERLIGVPYYRLIHAEADGIPGCVIDRFGDVVVVEPNAAGADLLIEPLIAALDRLLKPKVIVVSGDGPARSLEGLEAVHRIAKGALDDAIELQEHGVRFLADLAAGQKTGWFFDQRDNRLLAAGFAKDADVLDLYAYSRPRAMAPSRC